MDQQEINSLHVGMTVAIRRPNLKDCVDVTEEKSARLKDVQTSASIEVTVANTAHVVQKNDIILIKMIKLCFL